MRHRDFMDTGGWQPVHDASKFVMEKIIGACVPPLEALMQ
jgi:hypothetical protein